MSNVPINGPADSAVFEAVDPPDELLADLRDADLRGRDLRRMNFRGRDLAGAHLEGARLDGADLRDALRPLLPRARAARACSAAQTGTPRRFYVGTRAAVPIRLDSVARSAGGGSAAPVE